MIQWPELYEWGFSVFPLRMRDKRPLGPWEKYQSERANDDELRLWGENRALNGAIATGIVSGIFVVDLDSEAATTAFFARGVPETPIVKTAKGHHVYFRYPGFAVKNSAGRIGRGIDIRGEGGYVVAPGSIHPTGARYEWEKSPDEVPIAQAPAWLLAELTREPHPQPVIPGERSETRDPGDRAQHLNGSGSDYGTPDGKPYVDTALDREIKKLRDAREGTRNDTLNTVAMVFGQFVAGGHISQSYAQNRLMAEAVHTGLPEREARTTIASGLKKGLTEPRRIPERARPPKPNGHAQAAAHARADDNGDWFTQGITGQALQQQTFEPIRWVVPGIIVEGSTLLGARPKRGKSWMMLGCAVAVAGGGVAMGARCDEGDVLGLFLEDNRRRLNSRMASLMGDTPWPGRLTFFTLENGWPRLDEGGLERIDRWIESVARPRLVIVDVLTKVRPKGDKNRNPYEHDYEALKGLTELASRKRIAIVAVHHCRKSPSDEDPFDELSGTTGLTGAANTTLVLKRGESQTDLLYGRGHDVPEFEKAVSFDKTRGIWSVLGDADEFRGSEMEKQIRAVLEENAEALSPKQVHESLDGFSYEAVKKRLARMARTEALCKSEGGNTRCSHVPTVPAVPGIPTVPTPSREKRVIGDARLKATKGQRSLEGPKGRRGHQGHRGRPPLPDGAR
jgi:hypothetical protein